MQPIGYEKYTGWIMENRNLYYRIAYSFMGNEADSLDAISQMTLSVLEKHHQLRDPNRFLPWSKKILINACRKGLRDRKRTTVMAEFPLIIDPFDENQLAEQLMVRKAVYGLIPKYREIIVMRYYLDMEYRDISDATGLPLGTVKSRINRATSLLKEGLGGEF
jgi:RNA polymerase sigma-70 factor (ECF subfamily)